MKAATGTAPFLAALRGERPSRRPVWIMRQAGRYLPEYQELRRSATFEELCTTPELACEATLQPLRRFDLDAAILFSDILVPLAPMGAPFVIEEGGPKTPHPIRTDADVQNLRVVDPREEIPFVADAVRLLKRELGDTPLIGFAGAPFTLAAYLVEGGGSRDFLHLKRMLFRRPDLLERLLDLLADQVADHLKMQVEAGADAVQLFDTWGGILSPADHERFILPRHRRIFDALAGLGVPKILFTKGGGPFLPALATAGADALGLDWLTPIPDALKRTGALPVQGNLDPHALFAPKKELARRVAEICREGDAAPGHVFNLGHGIFPTAPIEAVETVVETVHAHVPGGVS